MMILAQDTYFLPINSPKHIIIPELNHINWELSSSLDMEKMYEDVLEIMKNQKVIDDSILVNETELYNIDIPLEEIQLLRQKLKNVKILLIEGFSIFNFDPIEKLCHLKFYLTLSKETCYERRIKRSYDPPDVPGYFESAIWPEHEKQLKEVEDKCKDVVYLTESNNNHLSTIFEHILLYCKDF